MEDFPLHRAAKKGDLEGVRRLIGEVSVNSRDDKGRTPMHCAAQRGQLEVILSSLSECDINIRDHKGRTPVLSAAFHYARAAVNLLLEKGARADCADENNVTLLSRASKEDWADVVGRLLARGGVDPNAATSHGVTPLMLAAENNSRDIVALLVQAGADVNRVNARKWTALHYASLWGRARALRVLLETKGLQLNLQNSYGCTPLHVACSNAHSEVVRRILLAGADPNIRDNQGRTAMNGGLDGWRFNVEDIRLMVEKGGFIEPIDYERISKRAVLKENVLKDVDLCTQSVVNKYHFQSLPALKDIPYLAGKLPCVYNFKLRAKHVADVASFVRRDIQANTFCNLVSLRPINLRMMCVESLLASRASKKRPAPPEFRYTNPPLKKTHHDE